MVGARSGNLDAFDLKLLSLLQRQGDLTRNQLAAAVHLSPSQCSRRIQRLKEVGVIRCVRADLDPLALGFTATAFVLVTFKSHVDVCKQAFRERMVASPHVAECLAVTGDNDLMLKVVARDMPELQAMLIGLREDGAVASIRSNIVLEEFKSGGSLPLR